MSTDVLVGEESIHSFLFLARAVDSPLRKHPNWDAPLLAFMVECKHTQKNEMITRLLLLSSIVLCVRTRKSKMIV